ncbi:MAG TPA: fibronectin type III domain-containing protein [Mycobacteriales bacterium]|nr:fibronectin type III domain-containing protein [Mycobacteriales bacterium]
MEFSPPGSNRFPNPIATIEGADTTLNGVSGMAMDHQGRLWVANQSANSIVVFAANANGDAKPVVTISGADTHLNSPVDVALTQKGNIWAVNTGDNSLVEYAAGSHGDAKPLRRIAGSNTLLAKLTGVAVSPDGKRVWVSETRIIKDGPSLDEYSGSAHGNVKPIAVITGSKTGLDQPNGVVVGVAGTDPIAVNAATDEKSAVVRFAPGAHGNAKGTVVSGENTGLEESQLPGLDAVGNIWVPNPENSEVVRFGPTQHGNVAPQKLFLGTDLNNPGSLAVFIVPPSAPRAMHAKATSKKLHLTWSAPKVKGGGILGYEVRDRKKGGHWKVVKTTAKPSYTKSHPHTGFSYDVIAFNEAGYSTASSSLKVKV